jgi:hypothetical protein
MNTQTMYKRKKYRELSNRYSSGVKIVNGDDDAYLKQLATEETKVSVFNFASIKSRMIRLK